MKAGIPAVFGNAAQVGGSNPLRDLAIPAGLVFLQRIAVDKHHGMRLFPEVLEEGDHKVLDDNLYSKLVNLVKFQSLQKGRVKIELSAKIKRDENNFYERKTDKNYIWLQRLLLKEETRTLDKLFLNSFTCSLNLISASVKGTLSAPKFACSAGVISGLKP